MKYFKLKNCFFVIFFSLLSLAKSVIEIEEEGEEIEVPSFDEKLLQTKCDGEKITYTIKANLKEYLENDKNIDGREIYESIADLKSKRIGICKGTYYKETDVFDSITEYENKDLLLADIKDYKIDAGIIFEGLANTIQEFSNIATKYPEPLLPVDIVFALQKNNINTELKSQLNEFIASHKENYENLASYWDLVWRENGFLNKTLSGENGTLNVIAKIDMSPHSYLRSYDQYLIGAEVDFIYQFARAYGYGLNFEHADVDEELIDTLKNKKADIALGFFVKREDEDDSIDQTDVLYSSSISLLVRYGNLPDSVEWTTLYGSIEEFNGENLGIVSGTF